MNLLNTKLPVVHLKPGELHIDGQPSLVTTVLGSCLSVTMFDRRCKVGAICHAMMPQWSEARHCDIQNNEGFKYVDYSIKYMIDKLRSLGGKSLDIEVKLFGAADMFAVGNNKVGTLTVGKQNIMSAIQSIEKEHLNICNRDIGGPRGRILHFYTHTGDVFIKRLDQSNE
jgi:chemotaxis protein CheD